MLDKHQLFCAYTESSNTELEAFSLLTCCWIIELHRWFSLVYMKFGIKKKKTEALLEIGLCTDGGVYDGLLVLSMKEFAERNCICMFVVKEGILTDEMSQNQQF